MVGGIGPGDDPLQLTGRADVPGADAGRRQAGSARPMVLTAVSMDHRTRHWKRPRLNESMISKPLNARKKESNPFNPTELETTVSGGRQDARSSQEGQNLPLFQRPGVLASSMEITIPGRKPDAPSAFQLRLFIRRKWHFTMAIRCWRAFDSLPASAAWLGNLRS